MIRRPPRSTLDRSSAASDVYKRQVLGGAADRFAGLAGGEAFTHARSDGAEAHADARAVSYTHLRAHETVLDLVCRLLLEKKNSSLPYQTLTRIHTTNHTHTYSPHE